MRFSEAVKQLFHSYSDSLYRFVYQKLGNCEDAEEIVQDTFHNYLRLNNSEEVDNPRAFLYKTAHNLALNHIRKSGYRAAHLQTLEAEPKTLPLEREVISQADVDHLQRRLHALPELTRQVFLCNRIEGKSYPQIAQQFNLTESRVQKHMLKALHYLRKHLDRVD